LLAISPESFAALEQSAHQLNLTLTIIGELRAGAGVTWSLNGNEFAPSVSGYDHFA
jgi:thiamine monophosphate kinase